MASDNPFATDLKLVGGHIPADLAAHLSLVVVSQNSSRNQILLELIESYLKKAEGVQALIAKIAAMAISNWNGIQDFHEYLKMVERVLEKKKISPEHIKQISNEMRRLYGTN